MTEVTLDRPHRFKIGDEVAHVDSPQLPAEVVALTLRMSEDELTAYPTYTLYDPMMDEETEGVLCTVDLIEHHVA